MEYEAEITYWNDRKIKKYLDNHEAKKYLKNLNSTGIKMSQRKKEEMREATIRERVCQLPRAERLAIYLHFWEKLKPFEIARQLEMETELVKNLIQRGLEQLKIDLSSLVKISTSFCYWCVNLWCI